jgi:hypothetical protein
VLCDGRWQVLSEDHIIGILPKVARFANMKRHPRDRLKILS